MGKPTDSKNLKEYDILAYTKGFVASSTINGITTQDYFQYKEIYNIGHHPNIGVEIIGYNKNRRIFYNNNDGESTILFTLLTDKMQAWMVSNNN